MDHYVAEERDLETQVAETVDGFESQVSEMIQSLSATMLAAVAVLIGSFIAAAFKDKFDERIFVIGVCAYMVYLLVFPGIYNMTHHLLRFGTADEIFQKRRGRFARILGDDATDRVIGEDIIKARRRFSIWFAVTAGTMLLVLFLSALAAAYIPRLFAQTPPPAPKAASTEPSHVRAKTSAGRSRSLATSSPPLRRGARVA